MNNKDNSSIGVIVGLLLPIIIMTIIIGMSKINFESINATIQHFIRYNLMYKILSLSLMPNAGLFLFWSKNKINQARGVLLITLLYGVFVIILYLK